MSKNPILNYYLHSQNPFMALRRMLVFEQVVEATPRRDKHTPLG